MMQVQTVEKIIEDTEHWLQEYEKSIPVQPGEFFFEYGKAKRQQIQRVKNKLTQRIQARYKQVG